jgi:hypothetical protein
VSSGGKKGGKRGSAEAKGLGDNDFVFNHKANAFVCVRVHANVPATEDQEEEMIGEGGGVEVEVGEASMKVKLAVI